MALVATGTSAVEEAPPNPYKDMIIPPEAQRQIIEKTAQFVANSGAITEEKILNNPNLENKEKFEFLLPGSPYRAYYDYRLHRYRTGEVEEVRAVIPEAIVEMRRREAERNERKERLLALKAHAERADECSEDEMDVSADTLVTPDKERFILKQPYIAPIDTDIIKLTAQFVAKNGQTFLQGLNQRERNNPQFEFLKSTHPAHAYFQGLVETYSICMDPDLDCLLWLQTLAGRRWPVGSDKPGTPDEAAVIRHIVKRMRIRFRWNAEENKKRKAREEAEAEERAAMAAIDWDDFVVVETIVFTEADLQMALPTPVDYEALEAVRLLEGNLPAPQPMAPVVPTPPEPQAIIEPTPPPPRRPEPSRPAVTTTTVGGEEQRVVLRPDYVRRGKKRAGELNKSLSKCPLTGQLIPMDKFGEHVKTLLIDPQYKAQREHVLARAQAESAFAAGSDVEANIAQFVIKRPDLFGTVEDEVLEHASDPMPGAPTIRPGSISQSGEQAPQNHAQAPPKKQRTG